MSIANVGTKWFSTAKSDRKRKPIEFTLPMDCIDWLTEEAKRAGGISRSRVIEGLIRRHMKR